MNIKQEINSCKSILRTYKKRLEICTDEEEKNHLNYQINQEKIKLESFELLYNFYKKVWEEYE